MKTSFKRLQAFIKAYPRLAITGPSSAGKTTLTHRLDDGSRKIFHNDDFKHLDWSESSAEEARRVNECEGPLIVEGVTVARALRKGMRVDAVIWLDKPHIPVKPGQVAQGKGILTVLREWQQTHPDIPVLPWAEDTGVEAQA